MVCGIYQVMKHYDDQWYLITVIVGQNSRNKMQHFHINSFSNSFNHLTPTDHCEEKISFGENILYCKNSFCVQKKIWGGNFGPKKFRAEQNVEHKKFCPEIIFRWNNFFTWKIFLGLHFFGQDRDLPFGEFKKKKNCFNVFWGSKYHKNTRQGNWLQNIGILH